jgi:CDP-4-dehydro-6-deoxyglucose reductase
MPELLSLSRAARLAGVRRSEMQERIRKEDVKTFDGKLTMDVLLRLYPYIKPDADPVLDRMKHIKASARPKSRYSDGWTPDSEILMGRLKHMHRALVESKSTLSTCEAIVSDTLDELVRTVDAPQERLRDSVSECIKQLENALQRMKRAPTESVSRLAKETLAEAVSANVRILPSGHEFKLEGNDSILEAGLKAGFYLDYGCSSHNCGKCKCKVVSGEVHKMQDHDYPLSSKEQQENTILACCYTADSDLVIEAVEAGMEEDLPYQEIRAVVRKVKLEGDNLALLHIQTPRSQMLRFKAGQRVQVVTEDDAVMELYIASCPCDGRNLQFIIRRESSDITGNSVLDAGLVKQTVLLKGPTGHFVLQEESTDPALFLARGEGFAPIKSLVEQAINIDNAEGLHLIQVGCYPSGSSLDNLCRAWNDSLENFLYTPVDAETSTEALVDQLASALAGPSRVEVYIAGPADWLQALTEIAHAKDLTPGEWHCQAVD